MQWLKRLVEIANRPQSEFDFEANRVKPYETYHKKYFEGDAIAGLELYEEEYQDEFGYWYGKAYLRDDISKEHVDVSESFIPGSYKEKRDKAMADGTWGKDKSGKTIF